MVIRMSEKKHISYVYEAKNELSWDWWHESPVELVLVALIVVMFFAFPRAGCGITPVDHNVEAAPAVANER